MAVGENILGVRLAVRVASMGDSATIASTASIRSSIIPITILMSVVFAKRILLEMLRSLLLAFASITCTLICLVVKNASLHLFLFQMLVGFTSKMLLLLGELKLVWLAGLRGILNVNVEDLLSLQWTRFTLVSNLCHRSLSRNG
jgi:hypothetical protein